MQYIILCYCIYIFILINQFKIGVCNDGTTGIMTYVTYSTDDDNLHHVPYNQSIIRVVLVLQTSLEPQNYMIHFLTQVLQNNFKDKGEMTLGDTSYYRKDLFIFCSATLSEMATKFKIDEDDYHVMVRIIAFIRKVVKVVKVVKDKRSNYDYGLERFLRCCKTDLLRIQELAVTAAREADDNNANTNYTGFVGFDCRAV